MTGFSILLFGLSGLLLVAAVAAIYVRESPRWKYWWRPYEGPLTEPIASDAANTTLARAAAEVLGAETAEVSVSEGDLAERTRRRMYPSDEFRYTIRRPATASARKKMPDLGGFSEVPLRLYDQLGNRFTVHQKVRLN